VDPSSFELLPNVDNVIAKMQRLLSTDYSKANSNTLNRHSIESISGDETFHFIFSPYPHFLDYIYAFFQDKM
jgi:hypothetical protein